MEIPKQYDPSKTEDKWYKYWMENDFFSSVPDDREPYTIVIPPPNVTGVLHMGHMLNNTIQDVLVRRARMLGKNALWVPGTDHASIATEAKVVHKLREQGIKKSDLSREEFLAHAFEWKEEYGGVILEQLKKLGASCDWSRTGFTMDPEYSESVIDTFIDLYNKGKIYRGLRMINWDPQALTALSDEEVIHKEVNSKLYYVNYKIEGEDGHLTIATTRPETILGDSAICINPKDERFAHLRGKRAIVPIAGRSVPIIEDEHVDMEFGTGCLKVTPAHDLNDYDLGQKHDLETIDIFNANGTLSEAAGHYIGKDRFEVRDLIIKDLEAADHIEKIEDYTNKVGFSERTNAVVEPRLSLQWWLDMNQLAGPALENVMNDNIQFHPAKFKNTYRHWMENIKDWCISRQLWWGHQIPAWYAPDGEFVVAKTREEAFQSFKSQVSGLPDEGGFKFQEEDLKQDEDVVDTWFSSWLWPITLFGGPNDKKELPYYYPTCDLVTAPDIIFFWVARMIMAGYEFVGEKPFSNVYFTGIVRDEQRRKMSKQLGNSPDPLELIGKYGADGVRVGMLLAAPAGNDLLFNEKLCEQGRNFSNKIWNAFRLVKGWEIVEGEPTEAASTAIDWFRSRLNKAIEKIDDQYAKFRMSDALMETYKLVWDDLCSWYLEAIKPEYQKPIDRKTYETTIAYFEEVLKLLHPFMPFISEEIWQLVRERESKEEALIIAPWPKAGNVDEELLKSMDMTMEVITGIRQVRKSNNIPNKDAIELQATAGNSNKRTLAFVQKLGNVSSFEQVAEKPTNAYSFLAGTDEYFVPMSENVDVEGELKKIEAELSYTRGFLNSVGKKLSNERFVNNAPAAVVDAEKKKMADAEQKILLLEERAASLTQNA